MLAQVIRAHVKEVEIPYLVHFTRTANLPAIMQNGLYPISRASEIGAAPHINDELRLDGHLDGISLSIGFPNYQMFWKYRQENPDIDWSVLVITPSVLWLKDCAFCKHNAADARISSLPLDTLKTSQALVGMYEEIPGIEPREDQKLKSYDPTDPQAEVLVFDIIEPELILGATFATKATKDEYENLFGERKLRVDGNKRFFASRGYVRKY